MKDFKGKTAVVTGAASGIGRGLADRFAAEGMNVVLADVEQGALDEATKEMTAAGATVLAVRTDVSRLADIEALAEKAYARFGAVHILCNNAGVGGGRGTWDSTQADWEWVLGVNLWGVINGVRTFVPKMLAGGEDGYIVNTASVAGLIVGAGGPSYTVSKYGVVALSESMFYELQMAGGKIKVSVLCPALTNTRILEAGRNHPDGPVPDPAEGTQDRAMLDMIRGIFKTGMLPSETAEIVLDAIRNERFYILTHPEHNPLLQKRSEALVAGGPPPVMGPGQ